MELIVLGGSFKTNPLTQRESWSLPSDGIDSFLKGLTQMPDVEGAVYLSTCNRVEIYLVSKDVSIIGARVAPSNSKAVGASPSRPLCGLGSIPSAIGFGQDFPAYVYRGAEVFRHLLRVASGLDSMVLGEPEILGQVKEAYRQALEQKVSGALLNFVFQQVFRLAKKIRTETGIARYPVSVSSVACMLIEQIFGEFENLTGLVVGLGEMGSQTAELLKKRGVKKLLLANRTKTSAQIHSLDSLPDLLPLADFVVTSTSAETLILTKEMFSESVVSKRESPCVLIDLGVPRDIDPTISALPQVYLYNVDDLKDITDKNLAFRKKEAEAAERMIQRMVGAFEKDWAKRTGCSQLAPHFVFERSSN